ncbi:hypothetical protein HDU76_013417, partial [Blyttiomyces sp. JEL0837]
FMMTDTSGLSYTLLSNPPIFYGGSTIPPPDGPVDEDLVIELDSAAGQTLLTLSIKGMLLCLVLEVCLFLYRRTQNARVYLIVKMSSKMRSFNKGMKRLVKDDVLLGILAIIFGVAIVSIFVI